MVLENDRLRYISAVQMVAIWPPSVHYAWLSPMIWCIKDQFNYSSLHVYHIRWLSASEYDILIKVFKLWHSPIFRGV